MEIADFVKLQDKIMGADPMNRGKPIMVTPGVAAPAEEPCDCFRSDCPECSAREEDLLAFEEQVEEFMACHELNEREDDDFSRQIEGGDQDDYDEEDIHGSRPLG